MYTKCLVWLRSFVAPPGWSSNGSCLIYIKDEKSKSQWFQIITVDIVSAPHSIVISAQWRHRSSISTSIAHVLVLGHNMSPSTYHVFMKPKLPIKSPWR